MGSIATLGIGNLEIDWQKNYISHDHAVLFQASDFGSAKYYYVDENDEEVVEEKRALVRSLRAIMPRLELLGFTLDRCKHQYERAFDEANEIAGDDSKIDNNFEKFAKVMADVDLSKIRRNFEEEGSNYSPGQYVSEYIFRDPSFDALKYKEYGKSYTQGEMLEQIHPYVILRLLAENPQNLELDVVWRFYDLIESGYYSDEDINPGAKKGDRFLIVTEGSSDSHVIQKSLNYLRPETSDFFSFIDMKENYPFTGVGNLHNFCKGLVKIGVENNVVIIYDNDAEGVSKFKDSLQLPIPPSLKVMKLPDLAELSNFACIGTSGDEIQNINGKAAAIECFLDFSCVPGVPKVRWTNFHDPAGVYQGSLVNKSLYFDGFIKNHMRPSYDVGKLQKLLSAISAVCVAVVKVENDEHQ